MKRLNQIILIGMFVAFSWLSMQAVHELGHVLGAIVTGGHVTKVVLHPCTISRTDVYPNPHPLFVVWAGPITGVIIPLAAYLIALIFRAHYIFLFRFFAGFCLITNGVYIGLGAIQGIADAEVMLIYGSAKWHLVLFGIFTVPLGLYLWNGLGTKFGLGKARGKVSQSAAIISLILFAIIAGIELAIGSK